MPRRSLMARRQAQNVSTCSRHLRVEISVSRGELEFLFPLCGLDAGGLAAKMGCYPLVVLSLRFLSAYHAKAMASRSTTIVVTKGDVPADVPEFGILKLRHTFFRDFWRIAIVTKPEWGMGGLRH